MNSSKTINLIIKLFFNLKYNMIEIGKFSRKNDEYFVKGRL